MSANHDTFISRRLVANPQGGALLLEEVVDHNLMSDLFQMRGFADSYRSSVDRSLCHCFILDGWDLARRRRIWFRAAFEESFESHGGRSRRGTRSLPASM